MKNNDLPIRDDLDFSYLLGLLPPLKQIPEYAWLPELFSIVGYERLLVLCKYAGGETIRIPKLDELSDCIDALKYFYCINISHTKTVLDLPLRLTSLYKGICDIYAEQNN